MAGRLFDSQTDLLMPCKRLIFFGKEPRQAKMAAAWLVIGFSLTTRREQIILIGQKMSSDNNTMLTSATGSVI